MIFDWLLTRDINECTEGGSTCKDNTDCWNLVGSHNCTCKVGFTGDPFSYCTDIDECSLADLNTCQGGMNPEGFDSDVCGRDGDLIHPDRWVNIGPTDENDGYTQNVQFELRGKKGVNLIFHECNDTSVCPSHYRFIFSQSSSKFLIWKGNSKKKEQQKPNKFRLNERERFKSYQIK